MQFTPFHYTVARLNQRPGEATRGCELFLVVAKAEAKCGSISIAVPTNSMKHSLAFIA